MPMLKFHHITSPQKLINILESERFVPSNTNPLNADSGINGYIRGMNFNRGQGIASRGAELVIEWHEKHIELQGPYTFPLKPNKLYRDGEWRAIIPSGTDKSLIKVVDISIDDDVFQELPNKEKAYFTKLKEELGQSPVLLTLCSG